MAPPCRLTKTLGFFMRVSVLSLTTVLAMLFGPTIEPVEADDECIRKLGPKVIVSDYLEPGDYRGSRQLAANIPNNGIWPTPGNRGAAIAVKSVWWSSDLNESNSSNFSISIKNLFELSNDAVISNPGIIYFEDYN